MTANPVDRRRFWQRFYVAGHVSPNYRAIGPKALSVGGLQVEHRGTKGVIRSVRF